MIPRSCPVAAHTGPMPFGSLVFINRSDSFFSSSMMLLQSSSSSARAGPAVRHAIVAATAAALHSVVKRTRASDKRTDRLCLGEERAPRQRLSADQLARNGDPITRARHALG